MRHLNFRTLVAVSTLVLSTLVTGTGCSAMKSGSLDKVAAVTTNDRVGSVYLLRGWIGIFSTGIDQLGKQIGDTGVQSEVYQETQWSTLADAMVKKYEGNPNHEPIVIIGHSYGADDAVLISRRLAEHNIKVDLVVTLDPVTPKKVPNNINLVYNLYQSSALDGLPWLRGIPLTPEAPTQANLRNMNIRKDRTDLLEPNLDHFNIEKKEKIHQDVIAQVMQVCKPRGAWMATRGTAAPVAIARLTPVAVATAAPVKPTAVVTNVKPANESIAAATH